ncbi:D-alanyl-D-alanine carboxypeptidase/D-alanyl-D-alanine-endopeptidase [Amycolatopsis ultiminotia]|uniref:D-alanyl-D-alanine carboxypeptidase/D-alanyl-D-alanine-endopeptidase n=1 Tax=Amycolatopsis ultiminotia TaxID=543629 RepID=A0ABP6WUA6_9PSEU
MPDNDQPRWPTGDEDTSPRGEEATAGLPLPKRNAGSTDRLAVPNVTPGDGPGSWFRPNVPPDPVPGVNAPEESAKPDPQRSEPQRSELQRSESPRTEPPRPEPPRAQPQRLEPQRPEPQRPEPRGEQTQQVPWVPVERPEQPSRAASEQPNSLFQPVRRDSSPGREREERPAPQERQVPQEQQPFAAFRDEAPQSGSAPDGGQGWAAFRPVASRAQQQQPSAGGGWTAFRSESDAPPERRPEENPRAREEPRWDALEGSSASWSQQLQVPVRPGLPEPPQGAVPPASAESARPMRIEPSGSQFPAEATVGIPRPQSGAQPSPGPWPESPDAGHQGEATPIGQRAAPGPQPVDREREQFASEATVGIPRPPDGFPPAAAPGGGEPKRRRKLLVIGLVVVLVLAAAGVASAVPKVSNKLGLPWAPNAPKGDAPDPAEVSLALHGPDTSGAGASPGGVASALAGPSGAPALSQLTGSVIDPSNGSVLWDHSSNTALTPASTTKILTVSAALLAMDPTKRLTTKIVQGRQPGTVILVGGGDPTLTALPQGTDSPLYPGAAHVDDLVAQVKKVAGNVSNVQVDVSAYNGPVTAPGWEPGDAPSLFGAPIVPVMADGGRGNPKVDETQRSGNPATTITQLVAEKLGASAGGTTKATADAKVLGEVQSAPLPDLAYALLQISDNVLADALGRQVAIATGGDPSFAGAAAAVKKVLGDHGFDVNGLQLFDTSGLSNQNKVPARLLSQVLAAAAGPDGKDQNTPKLRPLLAGLPVAGSPAGTLADRYRVPDSSAGKGWVRAKTGTLTGVNTLAGYVLDSDNRVLAFAFMSNGSDKDSGQAALDVLATALRKCGCQ